MTQERRKNLQLYLIERLKEEEQTSQEYAATKRMTPLDFLKRLIKHRQA